MAERLKDIPKLASDGSNLQAFAESVREALQVFRGYRGDALDKALTLRFVRGGGLVGMPGVGGGGTTIIGGGGGGGGTYTPDLTPPPTPTGLAVSAGISHIYVGHDTPTYVVGHGHDRTIVFGAKWAFNDLTAPTFSEAVELFTFQGDFGAYPSDPNTRWCIWIKWRTMDQIESASPAGGTNGAQVTTGQDVSLLLDALDGEITESQLYAELGERIDLIDGDDSLPGSVNARIAVEADAVHALYTVRVETTADGKTVTGGFGLAATAGHAEGPRIDFGVRADRFWIGPVSTATGVASVKPFVVQTADTVINGVTIPKGVYMDAAYINNLSAMIARLGNAWIDSAMIATLSAGKITSGSLQVGANIQSTVFNPGASGWIIRANGTAEFAAASIRDTLTASQLQAGIFQADNVHTRGLTVRDALGNIIFGSGGAVPVDGYRATNPQPQAFVIGESFYFKSVIEGFDGPDGPNYGVLRTVRPYGAGGDMSGGAVIQWFESNGLVWSRRSTSATAWGAWEAVPNGTITAANISTYIASAAIGSAQIANAAITNAKIGNLEVDNAKIANLAIGTEKLQDSAVVAVVAGDVAGVSYSGTIENRTTTQTLGSITTSAAGSGRVVLMLSPNVAEEQRIMYGRLQRSAVANPGTGPATCTLQIRRNSTVIFSRVVSSGYGNGDDSGADYRSLIYDTPGAGAACTYYVEVVGVGKNGSAQHNHQLPAKTVVIMEMKK